MTNTRKKYTSEFKTKVVLEVLSNTATLTEIGSKYSMTSPDKIGHTNSKARCPIFHSFE